MQKKKESSLQLNLYVQSLIQEDPTCHRATKPMHHSYWAPTLWNPWATTKESAHCNERSLKTQGGFHMPQLKPYTAKEVKLLLSLFSRSACPTLCHPMDCSTPGFPVLHYLPESAQTHVHWGDEAIQPSHPLSSPSPPAFNLSQHQGLFPMSRLFPSGSQSISGSASASVLPKTIQDWFPLGLTGLSKGLSRVFSSMTIPKHQFFGALPSLWTNTHIRTWLLEKPYLWLYGHFLAKWCLCFLICCLDLL